MSTPHTDADAYLARLSPEQRATLQHVRAAIRAAAPQAEEGMSYGMPAFIQGKPIAGYAASAKHCAYYPMSGSVVELLAADLEGYATSKGAIRFAVGKPLPAALIRKLVRARLAEIKAAASEKPSNRSARAKSVSREPRAKPAAAEATTKKPVTPKPVLSRKAQPAQRAVAAVLRDLQSYATEQFLADMSRRYGIVTRDQTLGTPMAKIKAIAKPLGKDHAFAEQLWRTGVYEARLLATMVAEPQAVTVAQMDRWAKDFDNWAVVDTVCFNLFDRTPHVFQQAAKWAKSSDEFIKRAGFVLLACAARHASATDADFLAVLPLIERASSDERNFVKKGVSWALRAIGSKRSPKLRSEARKLARELAASSNPTARWIGKDALQAFAKSNV